MGVLNKIIIEHSCSAGKRVNKSNLNTLLLSSSAMVTTNVDKDDKIDGEVQLHPVLGEGWKFYLKVCLEKSSFHPIFLEKV